MDLATEALVDDYVAQRTADGTLAPGSARKIGETLRMWARFAGPIDGWTDALAKRWATEPHLSEYGQKTRRSRLGAFYEWLRAEGRIPARPAPEPGSPAGLVEQYVAWRVERGEYQPASVVNVTCMLLQWHRFAGPIDEWTADTAVQWVHDQSLRPNARKGRLGKLRPYVRWLIDEGHLSSDIVRRMPRVKVPPPNPRDMAPVQVTQLLAACPDLRAELIVVMMVQCALRCVDLSRALIEDIDMHRQRLAVRAKGGGGEITHTVPIPEEAWELLVSEVLRVRGSGPIITAQNRSAPTPVTAGHLSVLVRRWVKAAGLKTFPYDGISAHALRHSCAQHMLDGGVRL